MFSADFLSQLRCFVTSNMALCFPRTSQERAVRQDSLPALLAATSVKVSVGPAVSVCEVMAGCLPGQGLAAS